MRNLFFFFLFFFPGVCALAQKKASKAQREYVVIRVYHAADSVQLLAIDQYLQASFLPAMEQNGFARTGFFKAIDNDTARDKRVYVIVPLASLAQLEKLNNVADQTLNGSTVSPAYTKAPHDAPPYARIETVLLRAFEGIPQAKPTRLTGNLSERVYELRSYESATEALHQNKVEMFNEGEIDLFERLGFNAIFYGQVVAGKEMPNLVYMTSFADKASRDEHWKTFGNHPDWKTMSAKPEYQHNVSKIIVTFLRPTSYSKL